MTRTQDAGHRRRWDAVVFDCDGTLLDTQDRWAAAFDGMAAACGVRLSEADHERLLGSDMASAARAVAIGPRRGSPGPVALRRLGDRVLVESFRDAPPRLMPGVRDVLRSWGDGVPLGVASNASAAVLTAALGGAGLTGHFAAVVSAEEVPQPKPCPDVYTEACARLGVPPGRALAVEDSGLGAVAAAAAGLTVLGVGPAVASAWRDLHPGGPSMLVESLADRRVPGLLAGAAHATHTARSAHGGARP